MRRLTLYAAASAALLAIVAAPAASAQTAVRLLSWPGKSEPAAVAPPEMQPEYAPFVAAPPPAPAPRINNRYSARTSAPRAMPDMRAATTVAAHSPVYAPQPYAPQAYTAPLPKAPVVARRMPARPTYTPPAPAQPAAAPYVQPAPVLQPAPAVVAARTPTRSTIYDSVIPDRSFAAPAPAPSAAPGAPQAAPAPAAAARPASPDGPRFYSVHREFGATPDRAPHPAVAKGSTVEPLPTGFFTPNGVREEDQEIVEERPITRETPAKPKRKSAKR